MAEIETLGILKEVQSIVSDKLQVVSYKWLSRNFLVPSNDAKRLLQEFVEKYGNGIEVVYSISGWLKNKPSTYHVKLVSNHTLEDAKKEFDGNCSVHVYSVQSCIPKDPATLWNQEFIQAEDLFKQPSTVDNCLRDNRLCGVSNSFVKRNAGQTPSMPAKTPTIPQPQPKKVQMSSPKVEVQSPDIKKNVKNENHDQEKAPKLLPTKKKGQADKISSGTGVGALSNMWGRASTKTKPDVPLPKNDNSTKSTVSAETQICARVSAQYGSDDEDDQDFNIKRNKNGEGSRKRRVVFDNSDDEDEYKDAVSLASPEPPKKSTLSSKQSSNDSDVEKKLSVEEENKSKVIKVKEADVKSNKNLGESVTGKSKSVESPALENTRRDISETEKSMKDKVVDSGPQRRKVLKTRIDERGREVTEVVWEGDEKDTKPESSTVKLTEKNTVDSSINRRLPVAKKSPAMGPSGAANQTGKAGNKKAPNRDPKQGNIMSFFRKV